MRSCITQGEAAGVNRDVDQEDADGSILQEPERKTWRHHSAHVVQFKWPVIGSEAGVRLTEFFKHRQRTREGRVLGNHSVNQGKNMKKFESRSAFGDGSAEDEPNVEKQMGGEDNNRCNDKKTLNPSVSHNRRLMSVCENRAVNISWMTRWPLLANLTIIDSRDSPQVSVFRAG